MRAVHQTAVGDGVVVAAAAKHEHLNGGGQVADGDVGAIGVPEGEGGDAGGDGQLVNVAPREGIAVQHDHYLQNLQQASQHTQVRVLIITNTFIMHSVPNSTRRSEC